MKKNIFVIGDLMIDHDVFVEDIGPGETARGSELEYYVSGRRDTAGGAANSARALAVVNEGRTYLWGILGQSHWGQFRSILERSRAVDGATHGIELRGVQDETDAPMDTTTRLISLKGKSGERIERRVKFYDKGHLHVSDVKRLSLLYHLRRVHSFKHPLDAIVINDFGRNCMTREVLIAVSKFALSRHIPLFIDPYRDAEKYAGISATAILPNLREWCHIVGEGKNESLWRAGLDDEHKLIEMAQLSFKHFDTVEMHIITCDKDGAVLILPHPSKPHYYAIYRAQPPEGTARDQVGSGDVLTAIFAGELERGEPTSKTCLHAYNMGVAMVAAYRQAGWHRMPSVEAVAQSQAAKAPDVRKRAEISKGVLFLPKTFMVTMTDAATEIPGLYSVNHHFRDVVEHFVKKIREGWGLTGLRSLVLGAPPGSGKSRIIKELTAAGEEYDMKVLEPADKLSLVAKAGVDAFIQSVLAQRDAKTRLLVVIDEAWKDPTKKILRDHGVNLLNAAHQHGIRFLLVSAEFDEKVEHNHSELIGRCDCLYLPGLDDRLPDIPYIIGAYLFDKLEDLSASRLKVEGGFILAATDYTLERPDVRRLCAAVEEAFQVANSRRTRGELLLVRSTDSAKAAPFARHAGELSKQTYEFVR